ncbi:PREDICTED: fatty-acid amide hydrolase 2-B [Rhagoletis zephyria]|uniref:fatty-acid amide hydrolase 2-B n=1 Tax=Rhagoletis zephyria TaxID=28612 RepID=UPI0008113EBB|nr:PREDICTED: fatty-acid amide hydrolase 2-B [Rhagoletis zephyria]XP_017485365.1 PREDICTED: fatty-acid amide hydrolase 2-B [Rhagoletis zephyria]XP_017485366.1 PREDICTED: fatty-acid amide hydrolase 2-B [Rhagoletis zephyria]XP_017485368.1 PREDICTED: fatty-acid amide hydrolase 2-B [Rhagoletis zephyria]XP_017485369.1 PREDICTED: fatty-acid amide hydrolase 2-B [Rhagoletis zephyria]
MTETNAFINEEKSTKKRSRRHGSRRHSSSSSVSGGGGRRRRAQKRCSISGFIAQLFFNFITKIVRLVFQLIYGVKGETMPAIADPILLESATSLARKIRKQELTSVQVLESFIRRIKDVNPKLNCCVDNRFDEALQEAAEADKLIKSGEHTEEELEKLKPYLGVPISTKDCIAVKGLLHTAGLYARKDVRATEDATAIALMRQAGAIPFALTNISEVCMWWESNNSVHGRTRNAYDSNRIVGGSSGGEGCIQSAAASPFGLGSDIGGSIRMPAFFNGVFGHKPSKLIVSNKGQFPMPFTAEQNSFLGIGPMSRFAEDLKPMLRIIAGDKASELNLDEPVDLQKVRFFYQETDGGGRLVTPVDADLLAGMQRTVQHLRQKLKAEVVEKVQLEQFRQSTIIWFANMKDDSGYTFAHQLGDLKVAINPYVELVKWVFGASKHTFIGLLTAIMDKTQVQYGSSKYKHMVKKRDELRAEMQELLGDDGVLLYPTHPTVAPYHNEPIFRPINFSYTGIVNVLGFPATAVPLGQLGSEGVPLGLQVIANFNNDRLCLAVAEELERAFGGWARPEVKV